MHLTLKEMKQIVMELRDVVDVELFAHATDEESSRPLFRALVKQGLAQRYKTWEETDDGTIRAEILNKCCKCNVRLSEVYATAHPQGR